MPVFRCLPPAWFLLAVLTSLWGGSPLWAADQPQWGQAWTRNMVSGEAGLPDSFDVKTGRNVKWVARLGSQSYSTPIVAQGRVYLGANNDEPRDPKHQGDRGVFMCFDEQTGALLWQFVVPKREEDAYMDWPRTGMSSTATVEGDRVYLVDNRSAVVCLDARGMANGNDGPFLDEAAYMTSPTAPGAKPLEQPGAETRPQPLRPPADGKLLTPGPQDADILWKFDLVADAGIWPHDAAHSSILIHGDHLYLNSGSGVDNTHKRIRAPDAPTLVVLDKATGKLVARDDENIAPNVFHNTWASPSLARVNGRELLFFCGGNGVVYAVEPVENPSGLVGDSGKVSSNQAASTSYFPLPAGEGSRVREDRSITQTIRSVPPVITAQGERLPTVRKVFQFDFDPAAPKKEVHKFSSNRREGPSNLYGMPVFVDGQLFVAGGGDLWWGKNEAWLKCIDATKTGDITTNGLVWTYPLNRHVMSTAAVYDGKVFIADCGRKFHCVDQKTGTALWTHDIKGEAWASPMVADGKIYLGTRSGDFYVFAAKGEKQVLAELTLGSPVSATATPANGVLFVATMTHLYAVKSGSTAK